jgi:hypothetical protein
MSSKTNTQGFCRYAFTYTQLSFVSPADESNTSILTVAVSEPNITQIYTIRLNDKRELSGFPI